MELKAPSTFTFAKMLASTDNSTSGIIELARFDDDAVSVFAASQSDYYCFHSIFLEHFQCTLNLLSLTRSSLPDLNSYDTEAKRQNAIYAAQQNAAKIGIDLHLYIKGAWTRKAKGIVLQNFGGEWYMPFLQYFTDRDVALFGKDDRIGCALRNLGSGLLGTGDDLVLHGSYRHELSAIEKKSAQRLLTAHISDSVGAAGKQVRPSNDKRRFFWIQNSGPLPLKLAFGSSSNLAKGIAVGTDFLLNWDNGKFYISDAIFVQVPDAQVNQTVTILEGVLP